MRSFRTPRSRNVAELSALTIAFLICLSVIVLTWPRDPFGGSDLEVADCCEVQTAELETPVPAGLTLIDQPAKADPQR